MASRLLEKPARRLAYLPNMRYLITYLNADARACSSLSTAATHCQSGNENKHSPRALAASWPMDPHFPLPGSIGIDYRQFAEDVSNSEPKEQRKTLANAFIELEPEEIRKHALLERFLNEKFQEDVKEASEQSAFPFTNLNNVECSVQECPKFLKKGFLTLFSDSTLRSNDELTIMTVSQHTKNDMTSWSEDVNDEREALFEIFVENAKAVCEYLQNAGYWADFIDPSSGQAYYSAHTNDTLFETDDRFNHLGFEIDDLGCCKVIRHKVWGSHVFVGTIFTNAPSDCDIFKNFSH